MGIPKIWYHKSANLTRSGLLKVRYHLVSFKLFVWTVQNWPEQKWIFFLSFKEFRYNLRSFYVTYRDDHIDNTCWELSIDVDFVQILARFEIKLFNGSDFEMT